MLGLGIKFVGALMSSWALFSALDKFTLRISNNFGFLISNLLPAGETMGLSFGYNDLGLLTVEMVVLAIGLTLLLGNFEGLGKK